MRGRCSQCRRPAPGYDRLPERRWHFVPLWGMPTYFHYRPRRVACDEHGVVVEHIPWSEGKRPVTCAMMGFLGRWGRRLSWRETAQVFQVNWEAVYRSVEWFVQRGLAHRELHGVEAKSTDAKYQIGRMVGLVTQEVTVIRYPSPNEVVITKQPSVGLTGRITHMSKDA